MKKPFDGHRHIICNGECSGNKEIKAWNNSMKDLTGMYSSEETLQETLILSSLILRKHSYEFRTSKYLQSLIN